MCADGVCGLLRSYLPGEDILRQLGLRPPGHAPVAGPQLVAGVKELGHHLQSCDLAETVQGKPENNSRFHNMPDVSCVSPVCHTAPYDVLVSGVPGQRGP